MNEAPDWSIAPPGTSHWAPETDDYHQCWYRKFEGCWEFMRIGSDMKFWQRCPNQPNKELRGRMVARQERDSQ